MKAPRLDEKVLPLSPKLASHRCNEADHGSAHKGATNGFILERPSRAIYRRAELLPCTESVKVGGKFYLAAEVFRETGSATTRQLLHGNER